MKVPLSLQSAHAQFEQAREALAAFRTANPRLVEMYDRHIEEYNKALNEVKALYKEHAATVGDNYHDFSVRYRTEIDAELLVKLMGDTGLALCNVKYAVDRAAYNKAVEEGILPEAVIDEIEKEPTLSIYGPKAL